MRLSATESIIIIAVCAVCTILTRALPFLIFGNRAVPGVIKYLGKILPMAVIATLVVYCLKDMSFDTIGGFAPYVISVSIVIAMHLWRRNAFLSIISGTVCYMLLVQLVFV